MTQGLNPTLRLTVALLLLAGCGASTTSSTASSGAAANTGTDLTKLPLGDGKLSTSPQAGYIFSCQTSFNGGGASAVGPWVNTSAGTYDFTAKTSVGGAVPWPSHAYTITLAGSSRNVTTNDLPNHTTGTFPIASTDPAYKYDQNPNSIASQTILYALPANPTASATPVCLPGGPIGILLTGSLIFNGLDAAGRDAVAHEVQDACQGHPEPTGKYHYHNVTSCLSDPGTGHSALLGYALDGFGIFGTRGENGAVLTNADFDACHGHTHAITWDGATVTMYHYHATSAYPYTLGCYHGTPVH